MKLARDTYYFSQVAKMKKILLLLLLLLFCSTVQASWVFDSGRDSYVTVTDSDTLDLQNGVWSISFWYKVSDNSQDNLQTLFEWGTYSANPSITVRLYEDDDGSYPGSLFINVKSANTYLIRSASRYDTTNTWYHVVLVFDSSEDLHLYVNGTEDTVNNTPKYLNAVQVTGDWYFGKDTAGTYHDLYGKLAEVAMWWSALSDDTIDRLSGTGAYTGAAQPPSDFTTNLKWYWDMYDALDAKSQTGSLSASVTGDGVSADSADHPVSYGASIPIIQYYRRLH